MVEPDCNSTCVPSGKFILTCLPIPAFTATMSELVDPVFLNAKKAMAVTVIKRTAIAAILRHITMILQPFFCRELAFSAKSTLLLNLSKARSESKADFSDAALQAKSTSQISLTLERILASDLHNDSNNVLFWGLIVPSSNCKANS